MQMFTDQITIYAEAGAGGDGVTRWRHEKFVPNAGPSGGDGGDGGDVYIEAVRDLGLLSKYLGNPRFSAAAGVPGQTGSKAGRHGEDLIIKVPVGSIVTDVSRERVYEFFTEGHKERVFKGGRGGLGNEHFKSSTNRSPEENTKGKPGESGDLKIELTLVVDVGLIGLPNAGKSTLLNTFTNAKSTVGAYPFTTLVPHLGDLFGYVLADIPGLIEGAHTGKGLGHTFLRHVTKTKMLLHLVSFEHTDPIEQYYIIRNELSSYSKDLEEKEEWIIFTKKDLANKEQLEAVQEFIDKTKKRVFIISTESGEGVKNLQDTLVEYLRAT
ncbi:MAG: GTPase ObgE, GTP-binding protein [Candidatus Parcubacteria bacterium]|jgi:GTP-binding protein